MAKTFQTVTRLGTFSKGEIPKPLLITFEDADDVALDLSGYTTDTVIEGVDVTVSGLGNGVATITTPNTDGKVSYVWDAADFETAGLFRLQVWVGDGAAVRLASEIYEYFVETNTPAPSI